MGICCDQEIVQMVGTDDAVMTAFAASLEECNRANIFTQMQALKYIAGKMKAKKFFRELQKKSPTEEARDVLANTVIAHVTVSNYDFKMKAVYMALMIRRVIEAQNDDKCVDDR